MRRVVSLGPSPRAWGLRLTSVLPCPLLSVHPHVRGVYSSFSRSSSSSYGPSPRAWGLRCTPSCTRPPFRSIPTCVGFTAVDVADTAPFPVHPHVRGVYHAWVINIKVSIGPSPRAWGLRPAPSCARCLLSVHPHVRGVYKRQVDISRGRGGPSPRAWGLRAHPAGGGPAGRSIPTCVGFTPHAQG